MEVTIPKELYESLTLIIKYQNTLLLKEIANEKNWKYTDLKKEFLKDQDMEELVKKYKKKNAKKKKKKVKEDDNINLDVDEVNEPAVEVNEPIVLEEPDVVEDKPEVVEDKPEVVEKPVKKKKKIKKIVKEKEIKCHKYIFDGEVFYVNVENENAYDKNMEFVGSKLGNGINFNADEKEN